MSQIVTVDIDLYKAQVGSAWQNLQANYFNTAEATGHMPKLIDFFGSRTEVLKQLGGKSINTVLQIQAGYWAARPGDPKYPVALGFRLQWGYWPNLFEVEAGTSWLVGSAVIPPSPVPIEQDIFAGVIAWAQENPLLAGGVALGGFLILTKRLRL